MLGESFPGHYLKHCIFVNNHPSPGVGNQLPKRFKQSGETGTTVLTPPVCVSETQSAQRRPSPLISTKPERLFLFCLSLPKKRAAFPESRIIYSRDQKAPCPENSPLMQLCRCHSTDMSEERKLGKTTWMSLIIQHD